MISQNHSNRGAHNWLVYDTSDRLLEKYIIKVEAQAGFFTTITLKFYYLSGRLTKGSRPVRILLRAVFSVCWYAGQKFVPLLDKLDRYWMLDASGYFVTARKP